jgi:hypothetical protein
LRFKVTMHGKFLRFERNFLASSGINTAHPENHRDHRKPEGIVEKWGSPQIATVPIIWT